MQREEWDGKIDEEAHLGLDDDDDDEPFVPVLATEPYSPTPIPAGWDANDDNLEELVEWDVEEEWQVRTTPVGNTPAPQEVDFGSSGFVPGTAFIADWSVDEEAHFDFDDDDDDDE